MTHLSRIATLALVSSLALGLSCGTTLAMGSSSPAPDSSSTSAPKAYPDFANAKAAIDKQDWPTAITLLNKVTAAEPKNPEAFNLLGYSVRKSGDPKGALQYYNYALSLDPKHLGANEYIGEAYLQLGDLAKAEEHLKRLDDLCTFGCTEYTTLKNAIAAYKAQRKSS
jgi:Flp pilus assembly protein TadD